MEYILTKYWNSIKNSDKIFGFPHTCWISIEKNASNLKRLTMMKVGIFSRITLNFTKEYFYGLTVGIGFHFIMLSLTTT